ncbi:MAG: DUF3040 domain-containing protein [Actinomycetia bacterium]|nr:DUF3040 domain-containing protein [Actinomycetes bacterium]MCH9801643.1 DUF3040 domain-containing protein [Actinomycetes bacterium]
MERALYAEDPKFADTLRKSRRGGMNRKGVLLGIGGVIVGLALLVSGVATQIVVLGIAGFLVMLLGAIYCYRSFAGSGKSEEGEGSEASAAPTASPKDKKGNSGFMDRLEERWDQRRDGGQY